MIAGDRERNEEWHEGRGERERTGEVDIPPRSLVDDHRQSDDADGHCEDADRHVDVEDPPPAEVVGEVAADGRTDDRGETEDATEYPLKLGALGWGIEVADRGEDAREEHSAEDSLQPAEGDELGHVLRLAAERGRENEADHAAEEERLPPEEVTELAGDRGERRGRDEV